MPVCSYAGFSETGAAFLLVSPNTRQIGMGNVFAGIADDALATYYNDAGMAFQGKYNIAFSHINLMPGLYPGTMYDNLCAVIPIKSDSRKCKHSVGVNLICLNTGNAEGTDLWGCRIRKWKVWDAAAKVSYANRITNKLSAGIGVKYVYCYLPDPWNSNIFLWESFYPIGGVSTNSWAADFSLFYAFNERFQLGTSVQNIGPDLYYTEIRASDALPRILRTGASYGMIDRKKHRLVIAGDLTNCLAGIQDDWKEGFDYVYKGTWKGIGVEYTFNELLFMRWGYFSDVTGHGSGHTFGLGLELGGLGIDIANDSQVYEFQNDDWKISLHYRF